MEETKTHFQIPQPDEIPERDREDAMGAYLMMFAAVAVALPLPIINLVAAIVYYFVNRGKSRFIHFHSLQSLVAQIPTTLMNWGLLYWGLMIWLFNQAELNSDFWIYTGFVVFFNLAYFVFSIVAAIEARKGKMYHFMMIGAYCYDLVFSRTNNRVYDRGQ